MTEKILLPNTPQQFPVAAHEKISCSYTCGKNGAQTWQQETTVALLLE